MKSPSIRISLGLFLIALTTLMTELVLMRVFDVILQTNIGYVIITGAMFAFGLAGIFAALFPLKDHSQVRGKIAFCSAGFAITALALLPLLNIIPFSTDELYADKVGQLIWFTLMYLGLVLPFFLAGLVFTYVFTAYARDIRKLYFFDLCGAAIGCIALIPFITRIGPGGLLFLSCGGGLLAAALFAESRKFTVGAVVLGLGVCVVPFLRTGSYYDFAPHLNKRGVLSADESQSIERTIWDPISKIDVIDSFRQDPDTGERRLHHKHVAYDGGNQSSHMFPFDGDLEKLRKQLEADKSVVLDNFWNRGVVVAHRFFADTDADALIIGAAAGQETKGALLYNPGSVDAVELVGAVIDLVTGKLDPKYSEFIGNIFQDPRVNAIIGEGRSFLRSTDKQYDVIQMFSNHTSSSVAAGTGAMATTYLQTVEAYIEYFESLKANGILQANHHVPGRMIATAAVAWKKMGRDNFSDHVLLFERPEAPFDSIPTFLIKMSPWTAAEVASVSEFMLERTPEDNGEPNGLWVHDYHVMVHNPLEPDKSFYSPEFFSGEMSAALIDRVPYRTAAATDDRPYFNFLRRTTDTLPDEGDPAVFLDASTAYRLNSQLQGDAIKVPMDTAHFFVAGAAGLVFTVLFIFVPLLFSKAGRQPWVGKFPTVIYFSCLGAAFIIVELTAIQKLMHLIGFPLYTYSVVIFTMLLAAGLGSASAGLLNIRPGSRWWIPFAGTLVFGLAMLALYPVVSQGFLSQPLVVRCLVAAGMIFPMAFFMGMPLPLGIMALEGKPAGAIAWAWGMNGLFTVIGGVAAAVISISRGFTFTMLLAFAIYALAAVAFSVLRRGVAEDQRITPVVANPLTPESPMPPAPLPAV